MSSKLMLVRKGTFGAPEGSEKWQEVTVPPHSRLIFDCLGNPRAVPFWRAATAFDLLPNLTSLAAGKDPLLVTIGTGTEIPTRAAKGGVNLQTQVTTPANNDNALLTTVSGTAMIVPITAVSQIRFCTRVRLTAITLCVFGAGLDENLTSPVPSATAGDGASFYFDPDAEVTTGLTDATANWILTEKVDGTDTYIDSGVPVVAGRDYELEIQIGEDLKPKYYIDGVYIATGASALTSGDSVGPVVGIQINDTGTPTQHDFDCRYVSVERFIG